MSNDSRRTEGVKLIGRRDGEFFFVDSVFDHGDDLSGVTGTVCNPVSEKYADELLSANNMAERFGDYHHERFSPDASDGCEDCEGEAQNEGCEACEYPSLAEFTAEIAQFDGIDAVIDFPGHEYVDALTAIGEEAEYADTSGCGRIFGSCGGSGPMDPDSFDEVYDRKALIALLAYESGAVSYEYACRVIFRK